MTTQRTPILRRALLVLTCATALVSPMLAQDPSTPPPPPQQDGGGPGGPGGAQMEQRQLDRMTRELSLSNDQIPQVKAILADSRQQMMALRADNSTTGDDRRTKMKAIHEAQNSKIQAILTSDQKAKYEAMEAKMRERRGQPRGGDGGPPPPPPSSN